MYNPGTGYTPSSSYGWRWNRFHYGQDWSAEGKTPISVAADGKVAYKGYDPKGYGHYAVVEHYLHDATGNVVIDTGTGMAVVTGYTLYAHMDGYNMPTVGTQVEKGAVIGKVGDDPDQMGNATNTTLHFEVRPIDPNKLPTDVNGDGNVDWRDAFPVNPSYFPGWDSFGGVYNQLFDFYRDFFGDGSFGISDSLSRYFTRATQWRPSSDPLSLDLDGDGIETVGINTNNPILFDHNADGVKTATGWIKGDDGLLVLDRNGNGVIDNGKELFGDSTVMSNGQTAADGFAALADLDSNQDGVIDANDTQFGSLKVWRDLNQDGISQANELSTLEQQNIASISLTTTQNNQLLSDGNRIMDLGTYTKTDGTTGTTGATGQTGDVDFAENTFYTDFTDSPPITPEAAILPNMEGSGLVRDLREAASIRGDLASVLSAYSSATTKAEQAKDELLAMSL